MTDKHSFLEKLRSALTQRNIPESEITPYIEQFDRFYDRMIQDDSTADAIFGDVDSIADNIAVQISEKNGGANQNSEGTVTIPAVDVHTQVIDASEVEILSAAESQAIDAPEMKFGEAVEAEAKDTPEMKFSEAVEAEATDAPEMKFSESVESEVIDESGVKIYGASETVNPSEAKADDLNRDEGGDEQPPIGKSIPEQPEGKKREGSAKPTKPIRKRTMNGSRLFWILFGVTLPITAVLMIGIVALFILMWAALVGVLAAAIAALVGAVALGAVAALVGIIYGITQLFVSLPIGLYEIGIGIIIVGVTMFVGILLYNFAVRLIPLLIKLVYRLFKFVLVQIKVLFNHLRKECAKL